MAYPMVARPMSMLDFLTIKAVAESPVFMFNLDLLPFA